FILDNADHFKNRTILDVGCGCGAGSIAAAKVGAKRVVANDIDHCKILNNNTNDLIGDRCVEYDTILIGDMFYNEEFASLLFEWLLRLSTKDGKTVLIGDPGRHGLTTTRRQQMSLAARYDLPAHICMENHGFTHADVWTLNKSGHHFGSFECPPRTHRQAKRKRKGTTYLFSKRFVRSALPDLKPSKANHEDYGKPNFLAFVQLMIMI
ncbi:hypothetical protein SFRURICE_001807, partial [Spodoptera frugiperda]